MLGTTNLNNSVKCLYIVHSLVLISYSFIISVSGE